MKSDDSAAATRLRQSRAVSFGFSGGVVWALLLALTVWGGLRPRALASDLGSKAPAGFEEALGIGGGHSAQDYDVYQVASGGKGNVFWPGEKVWLTLRFVNKTDQPLHATGRVEAMQCGTRTGGTVFDVEFFKIADAGASNGAPTGARGAAAEGPVAEGPVAEGPVGGAAGGGDIALRLVKDRAHQVNWTDRGGGAVEFATTGSDPYVFTAPIAPDYDPKVTRVFAFEYFAYRPLQSAEVFFGPPINGKCKASGDDLAALESWAAYAIDLGACPQWAARQSPATLFRLDLGRDAGRTIQIRNACLRPPTQEEIAASNEQALAAGDARVREYLARQYPFAIGLVAPGRDGIVIHGARPAEAKPAQGDGLFICEAPPWVDIATDPEPAYTVALPPRSPDGAARAGASEFSVTVPRFDGDRDRLYSRWFVGRKEGAAWRLESHGAYATDLSGAAETSYTETIPTSKKGLGGIMTRPEMYPDLVALGVKHITVNILMPAILQLRPGAGTAPFSFQGQTYYYSKSRVAKLDELLEFAYRNGIRVSAIILVPRTAANAKDHAVIVHPDACAPGKYSLANVATREGWEAYGAFVELLASRYCAPGAEHGRISNWILHNEINAAWIWTNAGRRTAPYYMNDYVRSMRAAYAIARRRNPAAKVFVSFARNWNDRSLAAAPGRYTARELTEWLLAFCRAEGDFEWGFAYHPYPLSHHDPATVWQDGVNTFSFDTPAITFKNVEVLDAYARRPEVTYRGATPRAILFSEQGVGTRDYSEASLRLQTAAIAYAWQKVKDLPCLEAFQYHRWVDAADEGGAYYGLWTVGEHGAAAGKKKPSHDLYAALDTPEEDAACRFAAPIVGIKDWSDLHYTGKIAEERDAGAAPMQGGR